MKILFVSDSFKGSLTSRQCSELFKDALAYIRPEADFEAYDLGDGGEGTLSIFLRFAGFMPVRIPSHDPLMRPIISLAGVKADEAFIESAQSCGLPLLKKFERNPLLTTSFGVGEVIESVLSLGCRKIYIGLGGTATNDAATGLLSALGFVFTDDTGRKLEGCGKNLGLIEKCVRTGIAPRLSETHFTLLTDVTSPLLGPRGAQYVFSAQKGADECVINELELSMEHFFGVTEKEYRCGEFEGAGAGGGMGYGLKAYLRAQPVPGTELILKMLRLEEKIAGCDIVVTGEGRLDSQSASGKAVSGVLKLAQKFDKPVYAIFGSIERGASLLSHFSGYASLTALSGSSELAIRNAAFYYTIAAQNLIKKI